MKLWICNGSYCTAAYGSTFSIWEILILWFHKSQGTEESIVLLLLKKPWFCTCIFKKNIWIIRYFLFVLTWFSSVLSCFSFTLFTFAGSQIFSLEPALDSRVSLIILMVMMVRMVMEKKSDKKMKGREGQNESMEAQEIDRKNERQKVEIASNKTKRSNLFLQLLP